MGQRQHETIKKDFLNFTKIVDQQTTNIRVAANADDR